MLELFSFAISVILISASGVMSPGPLFTANLIHGVRGGLNAGIKVAYGHTVVELPLIIMIGFGVLSLETFPQFKLAIAIIGALGLFVFAGIQIKSVISKKEVITKTKQNPFLTGIFLSALNPFFLIWWFTIGFKLISDAIVLWSFAGIFVLFAFHIWMDFAWLGFIAAVAKKGSKFLGNRNYKALIIGLSALLIFFGINFLIDALIHSQ